MIDDVVTSEDLPAYPEPSRVEHVYTVGWQYTSGLTEGVAHPRVWQSGDEIRLQEWRADAINRDSPGVLTLKDG